MAKCRIDGCDAVAGTRGMCTLCYNAANRAINRGETTWGELESLGLAGQALRKHGRNPFTKALKKVRNDARREDCSDLSEVE